MEYLVPGKEASYLISKTQVDESDGILLSCLVRRISCLYIVSTLPTFRFQFHSRPTKDYSRERNRASPAKERHRGVPKRETRVGITEKGKKIPVISIT